MRFGILAVLCLWTGNVIAADIVEVVKPGAAKTSIDLSGLAADRGAAAEFKAVLESDLERSGWFTIARSGRAALSLSGSCVEAGSSLQVRCLVAATAARKVYLDKSYTRASKEARRLAHAVADDIVFAVRGYAGIASTRIALVGKRTGQKELYVCDADGHNLMQITDDKSISIAPSWNNTGDGLVYTSFKSSFPLIYSVDLRGATPKRERLTSFPGLNLSAAIAPDGRRMALALSKDGNPDLYVMDLRTKRLTRVTRTGNAGEASPAWSPDGRQLVFVSDSPGRPHLFIADADGGEPRRLTFKGTENVAPHWGVNGLIAYTSKRGTYQVYVINPRTGEDRQITTDGADYEDPSWAPDGRHIVCSRTEGHLSGICILDTMGDSPIHLLISGGGWTAPAWSPK